MQTPIAPAISVSTASERSTTQSCCEHPSPSADAVSSRPRRWRSAERRRRHERSRRAERQSRSRPRRRGSADERPSTEYGCRRGARSRSKFRERIARVTSRHPHARRAAYAAFPQPLADRRRRRGRRYSTRVTAARLCVVSSPPYGALERAGGRRHVAVVAPDGDGDVAQSGAAIVRRVERHGAQRSGSCGMRHEHLDPGVRAALAEQVARDVARGQAAQPAAARACSGRSPGTRRPRRARPPRPSSRRR